MTARVVMLIYWRVTSSNPQEMESSRWENHLGSWAMGFSFSINLGKLEYFTNLNCWAIKGDDFPY